MKAKTVSLSLLITVTIIQCTFSPRSVSEKKPFDYLGQKPPVDTAILFAPGIVSDTAKKASSLAVSPNGDELFFSVGIWPNTKIMHMTNAGDHWSKPDTAVFVNDCWATEPAFSPDGKFLYFSTSKGKSEIKDYSLWRVKKVKDGWSGPENLFEIGGDTIWEFHPTIAKDGSLYFCYWHAKNQSGDIYVSKCSADKCSDPVRTGDPISSDYSDVDPFVSPEGDYMIFASNRPGGFGGHDQYISFRNNNGTWTSLKNLGTKFNTQQDDYDMDISPDGKFIFEYLKNNIYWMPIGDLITRLRN
jgi:Tol biopolymer transport system component